MKLFDHPYPFSLWQQVLELSCIVIASAICVDVQEAQNDDIDSCNDEQHLGYRDRKAEN